MDEEAVSPVIGTILLVAITVIMAGVAFLLVGTGDDAPPEVPRIAFRVDHGGAGGTLTVVSVTNDSGQTYWSRIAVADGSTAACTLPTGEIHAGDTVTCTSEGRLVLTYQAAAGDAVLIYDGTIK